MAQHAGGPGALYAAERRVMGTILAAATFPCQQFEQDQVTVLGCWGLLDPQGEAETRDPVKPMGCGFQVSSKVQTKEEAVPIHRLPALEDGWGVLNLEG